MRFVRKARPLALPAVVLATVVVSAAPAFAASVAVTDLTAPSGVTVGADAQLPVFGIDLTGGGTLVKVRASFNQVGTDSDFSLSDLAASPDGVALYRDSSHTGANEDKLDAGDTATGLSVELTTNSAIPSSSEGSYTYFLVVRTSPTISTGDDFTVTLPGLFSAFQTQPIPTSFGGITSQTITGDASTPTATLTRTPSGPGGTVEWTFSEAVNGVSSSNVVLRVHGSSTDVSALAFYNSVDHTATIDPLSPLTLGIKYDTIVVPDGSPPITDGAGNPVATTIGSFTILPPVFTPGVVRGNQWFLSNGFTSTTDNSFSYGAVNDVKVVGDWNGDGISTPGIVRGNVWYLSNGFGTNSDIPAFSFGKATDTPVVGDWDGDGVTDIGVVRGNEWFLSLSFDGQLAISFSIGKATDRPIVGDWNGDGAADPGVVRGNTWFRSTHFDGIVDLPPFTYGKSTDRPIAADWNGDGTTDPGVIRGNQWFLSTGFDTTPEYVFGYGKATDLPIAGDWNGSAG